MYIYIFSIEIIAANLSAIARVCIAVQTSLSIIIDF